MTHPRSGSMSEGYERFCGPNEKGRGRLDEGGRYVRRRGLSRPWNIVS